MNNIIPVITLWQPWATWIIKGYKTIETRTHTRFKGLVGKTIGIHAGEAMDHSDHVIENPYLAKSILIESMHLPAGVLLGTVHVDDFKPLHKFHNPMALIECEKTQRYGLFLSDIKEFERYPKVKGGMGIWYFDLDKMEKVPKSQIGIQEAKDQYKKNLQATCTHPSYICKTFNIFKTYESNSQTHPTCKTPA